MKFLASMFFIFFCQQLSSGRAQTDWQRLETSLFRIYFTDTDENVTWDFATLLENEYSKLKNDIGLQLSDTVSIFLSPSQNVFDDLTGHMIPDWGEGVADANRNAIVIKSPNLSQNRKKLSNLTRHELVHILIGQTVGGATQVPRWFNEGLACFFSYDEEFASGEAISKALIGESIIPLDEIDDVLNFQSTKAHLAYEESYSVIRFLEEEYGEGTSVAILRELTPDVKFEQAFRNVTGENLADFELNWLHHVEEKYRWRFLLDFETFIWIFMVLLFILVFVAIKVRNRRTMKRWDEEERLANL